jgi:hypothetical protein
LLVRRFFPFVLLIASCSSNSLDGSLSEAFDLSFSSVLIRRSPEAVQVTYYQSAGNEIVIRMTVNIKGIDVSHGAKIDLSQESSPGHPRAAVSRAMNDEPVRQLPPVARGQLSLGGDPTPGKNCSGDFSVSFGTGGDLGSGRTLEGQFSTKVEGTPF